MSTWKCKKWKLNSLVLCFKSIQSLLSVCRFFSSFLQFYFPMGSIHQHIFIVFYTIFSTTTPQHFSTNSYIDTTIHFRDQRWDFSATNQGLGSEYSTVERSWVFSLFFFSLVSIERDNCLAHLNNILFFEQVNGNKAIFLLYAKSPNKVTKPTNVFHL